MAMVGVVATPFLTQLVPLSLNPDTAPIIRGLRPTPQMPLVGFWKTRWWAANGVVVDDAGGGQYSVTFCGPGGCFPPGRWRRNTPIVGDASYRVVDPDTLELVQNGKVTATYRRSGEGPAAPGR
ncbi:MAG: hypothetical protein QM765_13785 [Myxococcales bacterium]